MMHDAAAMGWRVGERIALAPTTRGSAGWGETFVITHINGTTLGLSAPLSQAFRAEAEYLPPPLAMPVLRRAEVVMLSRSVLVTGDNFAHVPCESDVAAAMGCRCDSQLPRTTCTLGLHTALAGSGQIVVEHTRVEKCGQRGVLGKYCLHLHVVGHCPGCRFAGNAIEYGHQRGIVVHGTHESRVRDNVLYDVRGAGIYVEDGNEMHNVIAHNVIICPFPLNDPQLHGCTVPGTDNDQSDTSLNQAGLWALSFSNFVVGNRAANSFNGMLYQAQGFPDGRATTLGHLCTDNQDFGRLEGNTWHGHGRFGTVGGSFSSTVFWSPSLTFPPPPPLPSSG
jgi:hypothetical protein